MNILANKQQCSTFICCVAIIFFSLTLTEAVTRINKKFDNRNNSHIVRVTKMQCVETPYKRSQLHYCEMVQLPNGRVGLNTSVTIPIVLNYFEVSAKVYYKYTTYRPFMIDWSVEMCRTMRPANGNINPTNVFVMKIIEASVPDFYYPCPHGNRTYTALWTFDPSYIPSTLPSGDYRLDIYFRDATNSILYALQNFGSVRRQGLIG